MRLALDTNAYSAWKRGHSMVAERLRQASSLQLSTVVLSELLAGFRRGSRFVWNFQELQDFLAAPAVSVVPIGEVTADRYSRIASGLRKQGRPIPTNDIWIAATSMEFGSELLSFDAHFGHIDGLVWCPLTDDG